MFGEESGQAVPVVGSENQARLMSRLPPKINVEAVSVAGSENHSRLMSPVEAAYSVGSENQARLMARLSP